MSVLVGLRKIADHVDFKLFILFFAAFTLRFSVVVLVGFLIC